MSLRARAADCPKDKGMAIAFGSGPFKCRACGFEFKKGQGNKFNAKKPPPIGDKKFDSGLEVRLLQLLELRQKAGEIKRIRWKPKYVMDVDIPYTPEATYYDIAEGTDISVDAKGRATKGGRFPTICRLWRTHQDHPLLVMEQDRKTKLWKTTRKILPRGMERTS